MAKLLMSALNTPKPPPFSAFCTIIQSIVTGALRDFKFGVQVDHNRSHLPMKNHPWKGQGQGNATRLRILHPVKYLRDAYGYRLQVLYMAWPCEILALWWLTVP